MTVAMTERYLRGLLWILALGFLLWSAFIALGAGFLGAVLSCSENTEGCNEPGFPSPLRPWTWGEYGVFPEVVVPALDGLAAACAFVAFVVRRRRLYAGATLLLSLLLLSYPFFAGLTAEGRANFSFGPLLGLIALLTMLWRSRALRPTES